MQWAEANYFERVVRFEVAAIVASNQASGEVSNLN
jgi:hypothetical protein